jgi:hypothetical protein
VGEGIYDEQIEKYGNYKYLNGRDIADYFNDNDESKYESVISMEIDLNRTKTVAVKNITIKTRTETERQLIRDTITYIIYSKNSNENSFLTSFRETGPLHNRSITRKEITGRQIVEGIKSTAVKLNLDPDVFSLSSLRKGMPSTLRNTILDGESEKDNLENICLRGGWKKNSKIPDIHYNMNKNNIDSNKEARSRSKATRSRNPALMVPTQNYGPAGIRIKDDDTQLLALRERLKNRKAILDSQAQNDRN